MTDFLFIVNSFPPINNQNSIRAVEISKRLIKEKIIPIILTRRIERREPKDYKLLKEIPFKLEIYRTNTIELKKKYSLRTFFFKITSKIFYLYFFFHWIPFGYFVGKKILNENRNIRFIYSTGPPYYSHVIGYLLKEKFKLPLILEYRDPWSFNPYSIEKKKTLYAKVLLDIERKILKSADLISTISQPLKEFLIKNFPEVRNKQIFTIEHGINLININKLNKIENNKIVFSFIGTLYGQRKIEFLLKIIFDLKKNGILNKKNFLFRIFGKYNFNSLHKLINELDIEDLVYLGAFLSRDQIIKEINNSFLVVHIGENLDYPTISFKVWDYLSCRKKVLYFGLENSYTSKFLKENDFGITFPLNNTKKCEELFKELINQIKNNKFDNLVNLEKIKALTWEIKVQKLISCISRYLN